MAPKRKTAPTNLSAGPRKKTKTAVPPKTQQRVNKDGTNKTEGITADNSASAVAVWHGSALDSTKVKSGNEVYVKNLDGAETKSYDAFRAATKGTTEWYNEQRLHHQLTNIDIVCKVISSSLPKLAEACIYAQGCNTPRHRRGSNKPRDWESRFTTFDTNRRKSFTIFESSPFFLKHDNDVAGCRAVAEKLQLLWNEAGKQDL